METLFPFLTLTQLRCNVDITSPVYPLESLISLKNK